MINAELDRELDRVKAMIFIGTNAAFLGSLMCSMQFEWDPEIPIAATDGVTVWWNPTMFMSLNKDQRVYILLHEIWHSARLHFHRRGSRDPQDWNDACISGESSIRMADGTYKKLSDIVPGDYVDSPLGPNKVLKVLDKGIKPVGLLNSKLTCTPDHRILTNDGFTEAESCTNRNIYVLTETSNRIMSRTDETKEKRYPDSLHGEACARGERFKLTQGLFQQREGDIQQVYDLVTEKGAFIADDIVVHNCDYVINNDLTAMGYNAGGMGLHNPAFKGMCEEDVYDIIHQKTTGPREPNKYTDLREPSKEILHETINNVVRSMHEAVQAGMAGSIPGSTKALIEAYLKPVVPWERLLDRFMQDLIEEDYSWARPNRRYPNIYLPQRIQEEGKLQKLNYYLDVSGSITDADSLRFNSEVKFIKDRYSPHELNLIQFDCRIQKEQLIRDQDDFKEVEIIGRGGTSLVPVRNHIIDNKPTAAIIFTDLCCGAMEILPIDIPVIWVVLNNPHASVLFGEKIHINT